MTRKSEPPVIRSWYSFAIHPAEGIHWPVVSIVNRPPHSVALAPEDIFADLVAQGVDLERYRVIRRDGSGIWDELDVGSRGSFAGLRMLRASTRQEALAKLRARWREDWDAMTADGKRIEAHGPEV